MNEGSGEAVGLVPTTWVIVGYIFMCYCRSSVYRDCRRRSATSTEWYELLTRYVGYEAGTLGDRYRIFAQPSVGHPRR